MSLSFSNGLSLALSSRKNPTYPRGVFVHIYALFNNGQQKMLKMKQLFGKLQVHNGTGIEINCKYYFVL